jgi:hypothetical protein
MNPADADAAGLGRARAAESDRDRAHRAWRNAERIKRLSDKVIAFGPMGLGLDGALAWVPGANIAYTLAAGGFLIFEAVQSKASAVTLARMGVYLAADSALSEVPVLGWAADTFFPGHLMAARALQKDLERRHGKPAEGVPKDWGRFRPRFRRGPMRNVTPGR